LHKLAKSTWLATKKICSDYVNHISGTIKG